jgi:hypothetical protein
MVAEAKAGWRGAVMDPDRVTRSHGLTVEPIPGVGYVVRSTYVVQLDDATMPACECGDHAWRDGLCKHAIAAILYEQTRGLAA